jgi:DNA repair protein RecN (Recombination protein N)
MLELLRVHGFALIDTLEVEFGEGLHVLTGETGAGKSILVDALSLVLGARASADQVRTGYDQADIEAVFRLPVLSSEIAAILDAQSIRADDGELILRRMVRADGRNKAYVNGTLVPVAVLGELGDLLVDFHGQHDHQSLLRSDKQLLLVDAYAGLDKERRAVAECVEKLRALTKEIQALEQDDSERVRRLEFLQYEVQEIEQADLKPGEEEECRARLKRLAHAEKIAQLSQAAYQALYAREGQSALDALAAAQRCAAELIQLDDSFAPLADILEQAVALIETAAQDFRSYGEQPEFDPNELDRLQARVATIGKLKRKYGAGIEEILAYREKAREEIEALLHHDTRLAALRSEHQRLNDQALAQAKILSEKRRASARALAEGVTESLHALGMPYALFQIQWEEIPLYACGIDRANFLFSANAGEEPKPLKNVVSGGEMSRVMLALKEKFAEKDPIPTLIFDEIDTGVGGSVAWDVAEKLVSLARAHQVICITHLAQLASRASRHFFVEKEQREGRTTTTVRAVRDEERIAEIARLLDGTVNAISLEHARSLLKREAGPTKRSSRTR